MMPSSSCAIYAEFLCYDAAADSTSLIVHALRDETREYLLVDVKKIRRTTPRLVRIEYIKDWANTYANLTEDQKSVSSQPVRLKIGLAMSSTPTQH